MLEHHGMRETNCTTEKHSAAFLSSRRHRGVKIEMVTLRAAGDAKFCQS